MSLVVARQISRYALDKNVNNSLQAHPLQKFAVLKRNGSKINRELGLLRA